YLRAVFGDGDCATFRLGETWTEADGTRGRRVVRSVYKVIRRGQEPAASNLPALWLGLEQAAAKGTAGIPVGGCPRAKRGGRDNQSLEIRTVRVLWADLDHCAPDEALERCRQAVLPEPSIVVCSGAGVHLYWILAEPFLIDDAGEPPPVEWDAERR